MNGFMARFQVGMRDIVENPENLENMQQSLIAAAKAKGASEADIADFEKEFN